MRLPESCPCPCPCPAFLRPPAPAVKFVAGLFPWHNSDMKLQIRTGNMEVTDHLRQTLDERLGAKLDKYLTHLSEDLRIADVKVEKDVRWGYNISFDMWLPGDEHIYASAKGDTILTAVVELRDEVERQIKRTISEYRQ